MSKSPGNVVAPREQYDKYGSDVCRFYMLGVLQPYTDGRYREEKLKNAYNAFLANNYGNLLNRLIHPGHLKGVNILDPSRIAKDFRAKVNEMKVGIDKAFEDFERRDAVTGINDLVSMGNQHIYEKEPWRQSLDDARITLNNVSYLMQIASELYEPIIPDGAAKALEAIKKGEKMILFPRI